MTQAVRTLVAVSLEEGALGASQNMLGNAMHAVVRDEDLEKVFEALQSTSRASKVDYFHIGGRTARVLTE